MTAVLRREPKEANTLSSNQVLVGTGASSEIGSGVAQLTPPHAEMICHPNLNTVVADLQSEEAFAELIKGMDAVVVTLGAWPEPGKRFTLHQDITRAYAPAMKKAGVSRVLICYGMGLLFPPKPPGGTDPISILQVDMWAAFDTIKELDLDYTIWCPGDFPHGPRSTAYEVAAGKPPSFGTVDTGMVADSMLSELVEPRYSRQRVGIARS